MHLESGVLVREAHALAGMSKRTYHWRVRRWPAFAEAVQAAMKVGEKERKFRRWLQHPHRGKLPPPGKRSGVGARYRWGGGA